MGQIRFMTVTKLTRRPDKGHHDEGWFIYFGDVRVGHIRLRSGALVDELLAAIPGKRPTESAKRLRRRKPSSKGCRQPF
jgi:hypothetical protein